TTVTDFLAKISKYDEGQTLTVKRADIALATDAVLANGDVLEVVSMDGGNSTLYTLEVTAGGLSDNAVLTSDEYTIDISGATGTITGFDYGLPLKTIFDNVVAPEGSLLAVINGNNEYVPFMYLNYDTLMVDVMVSADIFFEVVAENGTTTILYQLMPSAMNSGAFVTSNVYDVDQLASLIANVPEGPGVYGLLKYIIPAPGATVKVIDKFGFERVMGTVYIDDRILVTSEDGQATKVYYLQMLREVSNYLAYVLSDIYTVDQIEYSITGDVSVSTTVSSFLSNLIPAEGAVMKVINDAGVEQTGNMAIGNKLVVTAGDGVTTVTYSINVGTGVNNPDGSSVVIYPNPSTGMIFVSGLEAGSRLSVYNMLGQRLIDRDVK
ncbi:MAG: hypothetical protein IH594_03085, partial [Bacteroidales bacterium]|nr:hypothetical protein [Bacteroidales bacterium]